MSMAKHFLYFLILCLFFSGFAIAEDLSNGDEALLGADFRFDYDIEVNANSLHSNKRTDGINFEESFVSLAATWKNKIRGVITLKLEEAFAENKVDFNGDFSLQEFVKEAFIEIRNIKGTPTAIIIGKQPIPFGQNIQAMPAFAQNPLASLQSIEEVYGVTVALTEGIFNLFDRAEIAVFESEAGDLKIGDMDGVSIRLDKTLSKSLLLTFSHAQMGNNHLSSSKGREKRTSLGLIIESVDSSLVGWVEGIYFSNNPEYPDSSFALTMGGLFRAHRTTDLIVEYSYIENEVKQYAVGLKTALSRNTSVGVEVRHNNYVDERSSELVFALTFTYSYGSHGYDLNQDYLLDFDEDENE